MSKKNFSSGLDDLFADSHAVVEEVAIANEVGESRPTARRGHSKNFVSDLDALLQEAMDEGFERYENRRAAVANGGGNAASEIASGKTKSAAASLVQPHRAPLSGLDALIRQTISVREATPDDLSKKRLTVAVDKPKLEKLKTIARLENAFLKDILANLIDEYIEEYSGKKGIDL